MTTARHVAALITAGSLLALGGLAHGQTTPTQADFDRCNQIAQAAGGSPSASPSTGSSTSVSPGSSGTTAAPSTSPSTPGSGSGVGTSMPGSTPSGSTPSGSTPSGSTSGAATSPSSDPLLRGIAAAGLSDPAYQAAYRDCMRSK